MQQRNNEKSEKMNFVKRKVLKSLILLNIILISVLAIPFLLDTKLSTIGFVLMLMLFTFVIIFYNLLGYSFFSFYFKKLFEFNSSLKIVADSLSTEEYIEVLPTKNCKNVEFLTNQDKLYAKIDKKTDLVDISILFYNTDNFTFFESVSKGLFTNFYKIK